MDPDLASGNPTRATNRQETNSVNCLLDVRFKSFNGKSCVCTKNNNFAAVSKAISSSVSYSCGPTATQDQASAATVLEAYCSQGDEFSFPEPETSVTEFITDVPGFGDLAPCAASGLAYVVQ